MQFAPTDLSTHVAAPQTNNAGRTATYNPSVQTTDPVKKSYSFAHPIPTNYVLGCQYTFVRPFPEREAPL